MNESITKRSPPKQRGPPDFFAPPPPPLRRPPGPLKLGPNAPVPEEISKPIWFRFRTRILHATASVDDFHQIIRLRLQPSIVQQLLRVVVNRLPLSIQTWFESSFPEWDLPPGLVLKKHKGEDWDEEFEPEKATYTKLQPLQGVVVPKCSGELRYESTSALLLSDIGGVCLATPEGSLLEVPEFRRMLFQALDALSRFRVQQDDIKLDNFQFTGDRIMALDLERLRDEYTSDDLLVSDVESAVNFLADSYEDNQYCLWADGLVVIES